ncbi:DUF1028 domain-containing protein [Pseudooceanicola sp. C21-150M6]|uniref:DUF1028 domain-containing protein n=1 Tax=Pseudooceanicola sp. C21-150M6 TaxID=3434355 RepID=UPI003D7FA0E9
MTFSIVARCASTGQFGVAISSSSPAVAARCAFARSGVGAVASQNVTNPMLGPSVLSRMEAGQGADTAVAEAIAEEDYPDFRQLLAVDATGGVSVHSGARALGLWTSATGRDCASGGNMLADIGVPAAIIAGFEAAQGDLGDRLIAALKAGLAAGGEAGPVHSAGLLVVDTEAWPYVDLRCDWTTGDPVAQVAAAWEIYRPQAGDYVTRAKNPAGAPSYGVPGDS